MSSLTEDKGKMVTKTVRKTNFSQHNDKRFYFTFFPFLSAIKIQKKQMILKGKGPQNSEIFLGTKKRIIKNGEKMHLKTIPDCTFYIKSSCLNNKFLIKTKKTISNIKIRHC